jgi:hypothetical protein
VLTQLQGTFLVAEALFRSPFRLRRNRRCSSRRTYTPSAFFQPYITHRFHAAFYYDVTLSAVNIFFLMSPTAALQNNETHLISLNVFFVSSSHSFQNNQSLQSDSHYFFENLLPSVTWWNAFH